MELAKYEDCTGCGACVSVCPKECIELVRDSYGFYIPQCDNQKCINCSLCQKVCHVLNEKDNLFSLNQRAFCLRHNDIEVLNRSTSGGAFTAIAQAFCNDSSVIYGVTMSSPQKAETIRINGVSEIEKLRKSKYVESFQGNIYQAVRKDLKEGKNVLYSGTPCQIAGLRTFLQRDYDNLLTVDIICHGVPTSLLLEKYVSYRESKANDTCINIEFRSKKDSDWMNPKIRLDYNVQKSYIQKSFAYDDEYMIAFCDFLCLRESCRKCQFAQPHRVSDITIGDFWGVEEYPLDIPFKDGVSVIICNTKKADRLLKDIQEYAIVNEIDYQYAIKHNHQLESPSEFSPLREAFLEDLKVLTFSNLRKKYLKPRNKLINLLSNYLSRDLKNRIKKMLGVRIAKY